MLVLIRSFAIDSMNNCFMVAREADLTAAYTTAWIEAIHRNQL
jgi:hypothetical protein